MVALILLLVVGGKVNIVLGGGCSRFCCVVEQGAQRRWLQISVEESMVVY
jgi:hypothetical protein